MPEVGGGEAMDPDAISEESRRRRVVESAASYCAVTDVGRLRDKNEDAFWVSPDARLLAVVDGMGGHSSGEVASSLAVAALVEYLDADKRKQIEAAPEDAGAILLHAVRYAHDAVLEEASRDPLRRGMGATLLVAYVTGDLLTTCHVGDVRCYGYVGGSLKQLTRDHSVVEGLVKTGQIAQEAARVHPRRNQVLQAVGFPSRFAPSLGLYVLVPGERVLMCSDGLWEALSAEEIAAHLGSPGLLLDCAIRMVDHANAVGGRDNITIVLYEHATVHGLDSVE